MHFNKIKIRTIIPVLLLSFVVTFSLMANKSDDTDKHSEVDFSLSCTECHQEETPEIVKEWRNSDHGIMNFGCYMCHGDGEVEFESSPSTERCISCHSDQEVDFTKVKLQNCFDCHQGHSLKFHRN